MTKDQEYYRRHLPHWQPSGATFFVTFRLKGSLPYEAIESLRAEREREKGELAKLFHDGHTKQDYLDEHHPFSRWDALLDKAEFGHRWLSQTEVAEIVKEALHITAMGENMTFTLSVSCQIMSMLFSSHLLEIPPNCH